MQLSTVLLDSLQRWSWFWLIHKRLLDICELAAFCKVYSDNEELLIKNQSIHLYEMDLEKSHKTYSS